MSYPIIQEYIKFGNARSGYKIQKVLFLVAHDIGNGGSTARNNRSYFHNAQPSASAHTFIDDKEILEIIPLNEKAWHVQYQKPTDNLMFGDDANDAAIGVELCWGGKIDFEEAYKRYVWYFAHLCKKYGFNPKKHIVAHSTLDPQRKTDPQNAFHRNGKTWDGFIQDVVNELTPPVKEGWKKENGKWFFYESGKVAKSKWVLHTDKKWYYLESDGSMAEKKWIRWKEKWFYVNEKGEMLTGWFKDYKSRWFFTNDKGELQTGWLKDKEKWYWIDEDNGMLTGWKFIKGKWNFFNPSGDLAVNAEVAVKSVKVNKDGSIEKIN